MLLLKSIFLKFSNLIIILTLFLTELLRRLRFFFSTLRNQLPILYRCLTSKFTVSLPLIVLFYGLYKFVEMAEILDLDVFRMNIFVIMYLTIQNALGLLILCAVLKRVACWSFTEQLTKFSSLPSNAAPLRYPALLASSPVLNGGIDWDWMNKHQLSNTPLAFIKNAKDFQTELDAACALPPLEPDPISSEYWCFFARTLSDVDPFDASRWASFASYPFYLVREYITAPEFSINQYEFAALISTKFRVTSNILFMWDIDGLTRLFIVLKLVGRYGGYLPELMIFLTLVYFLVRHKTLQTERMYFITVDIVHWAAMFNLAFVFLPFSPAELFTGYKMDGYGQIVKFLFLMSVAAYLASVLVWQLGGKAKKEIYVVTLFFILFGLIMISCSNFWLFFFSLEGVSFCVIIFFVFNFSARGSIADAIRYFCLNSIAAGSLLVSLGLGTHVTGTANYYEFGNFFMLNPNIAYISENFNVAIILFLIGSLFKLGIFPFNVYEVDTYKNSSYVVIFFAAIVSKVPFFFVWLKLVWRIIPFVKVVFPILFVLGLFSALVGTIAAIFQTNLRAFLAYSSMSHTGLILTSFTTESALGVDTAILYFITYVLAMSGVYLVLATSEGIGLDLHSTGQLRELRHNFSLAVCFTIFLLTLAGFPPLMGFFAKVGFLINLATIGQIWSLIFVLVLNVVSFGYYARVLRSMWLEVNHESAVDITLEDGDKFHDKPLARVFMGARIIALCLAVFSLTIFFTFEVVIAITGALWCVAYYFVDWNWFIRNGLAGFKYWLFFFTDRDIDFYQRVKEWNKQTAPKPKQIDPNSDEHLFSLYARRHIEIPPSSRLYNKKMP